MTEGLNALGCNLPNLGGEIPLREWANELLALKDKEETLSLLLIYEATYLCYLCNL